MNFPDRHALLLSLAGTLLASVLLAPAAWGASAAREHTAEILNFPGAPFELLPGPEGENGPSWGGLVSVSCYVHNLSGHVLSQAPLRVARLTGTGTSQFTYAWHGFLVDLQPGGLEPGGTTYILLTLDMPVRPISQRYVITPAAGAGPPRVGWEKARFVDILRAIDRGEEQPKVMAKSRIDLEEKPAGKTACATLRREADAACAWGLDTFHCVAPSSHEPLVTSTCAQEPGVVRRARLRHPEEWNAEPASNPQQP